MVSILIYPFGFLKASLDSEVIITNVELSCRKGPTKKPCYPEKCRRR